MLETLQNQKDLWYSRYGSNIITGTKEYLVFSILVLLWRACNLTSFSPCLTGTVDYLFASRHKGGDPGSSPRGVYLCETRIALLALSCYSGDPDMIDHCGLV